jgi:hypothetical protein
MRNLWGIRPVSIHHSKIRDALLARLKSDLKIKMGRDPYVLRLYHEHWQRSAGAWSWVVEWHKDPSSGTIGSQWPMKAILKAKKIIATQVGNDTHIEVG